ncbi:MAG: S8 family serine peptidase [Bacteroidia bacterium]|nr:S8 family serine peptidase [Bacteroidia bacterium]
MKRIIYLSLTLISLLFCAIYFYATQSSIKHKADEYLKIIVNLDTAIISGNTYVTHASNIKQEKIRALLLRFNVKEIKAVYRNRYNEKGNLKPSIITESSGTWQQININDYSKAAELITLLKKEKYVSNAYIEQPLPFKPCIAPNDAKYQNQWHLNSISSPMADIRAEQAWDINKGRSDVIIAVCDGGVDYTHPDLDPGDRSRVIAGYDSGDDDNDPIDDLIYNTEGSFGGHGTHVAGIIGAITNNGSLNNGENVAGVMWNCKIMPVKMVGTGRLTITYPFGSYNWDFSTTAFPSDVADAIDYAVNNGARVINLSYGRKYIYLDNYSKSYE